MTVARSKATSPDRQNSPTASIYKTSGRYYSSRRAAPTDSPGVPGLSPHGDLTRSEGQGELKGVQS